MLYPGGIHLILLCHQLVQFGFGFLDFLRSPRIVIRWNLRIRKFIQLIRKIVNSLLHGIRQLVKAFQRRSCYAHGLIRRGFQFGKVRCQRIEVFLEIRHRLLGGSRIKRPGKVIILRTVHLIFHVFQCSVQAVHLRLELCYLSLQLLNPATGIICRLACVGKCRAELRVKLFNLRS